MTANQARILIASGFIVLAAVVVLMTPSKGPQGFLDEYFAWVVIALIAVAAVLEVKEWFTHLREDRAGAESKATAIQVLPAGEPSEGGDR